MNKTIRVLFLLVFTITFLILSAGCEPANRAFKSVDSSINGLDRVAIVYNSEGEKISEYEGKFDVEVNEYGNKIKFDINGKRILIYNATVIIEEK